MTEGAGMGKCAYGCGKEFTPSKKGKNTPRGHKFCYDRFRMQHEQRRAAEVDQPIPELSDPLADKIRAALLKSAASVVELANALDVSPRRIEAVVAGLRERGFNLAIQEAEGEAPMLMIERHTVGERQALQINAEKFYEGHRVDFGLVSDTHLGSKFYREEVLNAIYDNFAKHDIRHVFHGGNYIEGEARFNRFQLVCRPGMQGQIDYFIDKYPQRKGITTYFVAGDDHEGWYQQREGIDIGRFTQVEAEKQGRKDLVNLGYMEADVVFRAKNGDCVHRVMHAGGGSAYAISYTAQKIIESFEGGEKPQILSIGHFHKSEYLPAWRNVHALQLGTTKAQDTFMRKKRLAAMVGGWRCSALLDSDGVITEFSATYLPFFNRGYFETMAINGDDRVEFKAPNETFNIVTR